MRSEILTAAEQWRDDWTVHKSYDQPNRLLLVLQFYSARGQLDTDRRMEIFSAAMEWANGGTRERLDELLETLPE
ncbi:MAG: hypothetical protein ACRDT4_05815 [Micromonosporaceae bacterium]